MNIIAHIPERLIIFCQRPYEREAVDGETYMVTPAYPVDEKADKKVIENARKWSNERTFRNGSYLNIPGKEEIVENKEFTNIRIIELDIRGQGGRAFKILLNNKYYFDMRENDLLEIIGKHGIKAGGLLVGKYRLIKNGSQLRIVNIESKLYNEILKSNEENKLKPISLKNLVPGEIYKERNGVKSIYLGRVTELKIDIKYKYDYHKREYILKKINVTKNKTLWLDIYTSELSKKGLKECFKDINNEKLKFRTSHKFIKKIGQTDLYKSVNLKENRERSLNLDRDFDNLDFENYFRFHFDLNEEIKLTKAVYNKIERFFINKNIKEFSQLSPYLEKENIKRKVKSLGNI